MTKVFISWSGDLSQKLACALRDWLPSALQFAKPYFSPDDIEKGSRWHSEISGELESSNVGIICVTSENAEKPWIVFEAGALSKSLEKSRVCPLLFSLEPTDIKGPLASFQATKFDKEDFKRLLETINSANQQSSLEPKVLDDVFDMWWPKLEEKIEDILRSHGKNKKDVKRSDRDILEEILSLTRSNSDIPIRHPFAPTAVKDLMMHMIDLRERLEYNKSDPDALKTLSSLEPVLRYICDSMEMQHLFDQYRLRYRMSESIKRRESAIRARERSLKIHQTED